MLNLHTSYGEVQGITAQSHNLGFHFMHLPLVALEVSQQLAEKGNTLKLPDGGRFLAFVYYQEQTVAGKSMEA